MDTVSATAVVCATCRVITVEEGGAWAHPVDLREKFSDVVCQVPAPGRVPKPRELRFGRGDSPRSDKFQFQDALPELWMPPGEAVALATNGSYKVTQAQGHFDGVSWGYVATNGVFGLGTAVMPAHMIGDVPGVHAELRAIWRGMRRLVPQHPVVLVSNNTRAIQMVEAWKNGKRPMPSGYDRRTRPSGRTPTLIELAQLVEDNARSVQTLWVRAGEGMALNEGAHSLARIAQAWGSKRLGRTVIPGEAAAAARRTFGVLP